MTAPAPSLVPANVATNREQVDVVRRKVRELLEQSPAFAALPHDKQREIAHQTVQVCSYLAAPEGIPGNQLPTAQALAGQSTASLRSDGGQAGDPTKFVAQGAREGAAVAGALLQAVNFPTFVSGLIEGVFHAIVKSSIEQMQAYGKLVADVAKTLNQFRDENVTENQGRDYLCDTFPDLFDISVDSGDGFGGGDMSFADAPPAPRVVPRDGIDEASAVKRVNASMTIDGGPITNLDPETIEGRLVPAARTTLATSRQQLLATMVLMGINRIVVTDGRISAKVMYDFQARDNFKSRYSATRFDYDPNKYQTTSKSSYSTGKSEDDSSSSSDSTTDPDSQPRDASYYTKGAYQYSVQPVLTLQSASQATTDVQLQTKASLAGNVEVNFKSETFPLDKMADSFQIGRIQNAARPPGAQGGAQNTASTAAPGAGQGSSGAGTTPPASGAATTTPSASSGAAAGGQAP